MGVHPRILQPGTFPAFNLYVRNNGPDSALLFRAAGEPVYLNTWDRLEQLGTDQLYVRPGAREKCLDYVQTHLQKLLAERDVPVEHLAGWIYRLACRAVSVVLEEPDRLSSYRHLLEMVLAIVQMVERDPLAAWHMLADAPVEYEASHHSVNVCALLASSAEPVLRIRDERVLTDISVGGALHDLGKLAVSDRILNKPAKLTPEEFAEVTRHPRQGVEIAGSFLRGHMLAARVVAQHHENMGGDGYPEGRTGESINAFARVARIVDVFDALTSNRPYAEPQDHYSALKIMSSEMDGAFDPKLLRRFIKHFATAMDEDGAIRLPTPKAETEEAPSAPSREPERDAPETSTDGVTEAEQTAEDREEYAATEAETRLSALLEEAERMREASSAAPKDVDLKTGILGALRGALAGRLAQGQAPQSEAEAAPRAPAEPVQAEVQAAQALMPLIWEIDRWWNRFDQGGGATAAAPRLRSEFLKCLGALRAETVRALRENHTELIEDTADPDARLYQAAPCPSPGSQTAGQGVHRVGFVYRNGSVTEVLEPALVFPPSEKRRAG